MVEGFGDTFNLFLIVILFISAVLTVYPVIANVAHNNCIMQQWNLLRSFDRLRTLVQEKGVSIDESFLVMSCTECIWYDPFKSEWVIKHTKEEQVNLSIDYSVIGVAQNCNSCIDPEFDVDDDTIPEKCANMVKDRTYQFEVGEDYVKCLDCPLSPNLCDHMILFDQKREVVSDSLSLDGNPIKQQSISLVSFQNQLWLFYANDTDNNISYKTSYDGITWSAPKVATSGILDHRDPSAVVFNGELYLAYVVDQGAIPTQSGWEIYVQKWSPVLNVFIGLAQITNNNEFDRGPYLTVYNNELHLFYHRGGFNAVCMDFTPSIRYRTCNSNCELQASWGGEKLILNPGETSGGRAQLYPSAIENPNDGKLYLSYTYDKGPIGLLTCGHGYRIRYKTYDSATDWSSEEIVTPEGLEKYEKSRLIFYNGMPYIFYYYCEGNNWDDAFCNIYYKAYDGEWKMRCGAVGGKKPDLAVVPAPVVHSGKVILCYMNYDGDWKIYCQ